MGANGPGWVPVYVSRIWGVGIGVGCSTYISSVNVSLGSVEISVTLEATKIRTCDSSELRYGLHTNDMLKKKKIVLWPG